MCQKRSCRRFKIRGKVIKVDDCLPNLIHSINRDSAGFKTLASCCGHGKYQMSIIVKTQRGQVIDLLSGFEIPRKKRFYVKDKEGYYYLPEVVS